MEYTYYKTKSKGDIIKEKLKGISIVLSIILLITVIIVGVVSLYKIASDVEYITSTEDRKYINFVQISDNVIYDKDTKVMYFYMYHTGVSPIYNSDGTLKLYDEDKK